MEINVPSIFLIKRINITLSIYIYSYNEIAFQILFLDTLKYYHLKPSIDFFNFSIIFNFPSFSPSNNFSSRILERGFWMNSKFGRGRVGWISGYKGGVGPIGWRRCREIWSIGRHVRPDVAQISGRYFSQERRGWTVRDCKALLHVRRDSCTNVTTGW